MGNKKTRKRKCDHTRDDALHNEKQKLKYHEKKKQKNTNIEDVEDIEESQNDANIQSNRGNIYIYIYILVIQIF